MKEARCPDCGYRLKTNECPICMKKVPFVGVPQKPQATQARTYTRTDPEVRTHTHNRNRNTKHVSAVKLVLLLAVGFPILSMVLAVCGGIAGYVGDLADQVNHGYMPVESAAYIEDIPADADIVSIEAQESYASEKFTVTAERLVYEAGDYLLYLTVHNNTDRDITVMSDGVSVNGCILGDSFYFAEVEAFGSTEDYMLLYSDELERNGIHTIAEISYFLGFYDKEEYTYLECTDWKTLDTSAPDDYVQQVDRSGTEVYSGEDLYVRYRGVEFDSIGYCTIELSLENASDKHLWVQIDDMAINGETTDGLYTLNMPPDASAIIMVYCDASTIGIMDADNIKDMSMWIYAEDWWNYSVIVDTVAAVDLP